MNKRNSDGRNPSPKKMKRHTYGRPDLIRLDPKRDSLTFQQIEIDHYIGSPMEGMPGPTVGSVPVMRMYGVTMDGFNVLCHVHGFTPYFYVTLPDAFNESDCLPFKKALNKTLCTDSSENNSTPDSVLEVQIVRKKCLQGYKGEKNEKFAMIRVAQPKLISASVRQLENSRVYDAYPDHDYRPYESNVDFDIRFMVDMNIKGCCWIELPANKWKLRSDMSKSSTCHYEVDVAFDSFVAHLPEGEWAKVAPFYILSFDIECAGRPNTFPDPNIDPIIQIANVVQKYGDTELVACNVFTLNTCAPIAHAEVYSFDKETDLLNAWVKFIHDVDPDFVTGYNINNFDLPYIIDRAKHLKQQKCSFLGRLKSVPSTVKVKTNQSKAMGKRIEKSVNMQGRLAYDMFLVVKRTLSLRSYTLNNSALQVLGEQKEDVHFSQITGLQNGDQHTRHRLAVYCIKDAMLPLRIMDRLNSLTNDMELARVSGVTITTLLTRGEQVKVVTQLLSHARHAGYLMPVHHVQASEEQYEGATVIEPKKDYYTLPIATLDFSSLYPSIMMAHNLCYTTLVQPYIIDKLGLKEEDITKTPKGNYFVKSSVRCGLLPEILENLLKARKRAKNELAAETDPSKKAVLNGRQLALKISANSVYGFTGAQVGKLPCLEISGSVTSYGREMIELTRKEVEERFTLKNGYLHDAQVVYGDTDSVMVKFGVEEIAESMKLGREAAEFVSAKFIKPIKLEFEKVYCPYLLINKKRYAGLYYTRPDKYDKMDCKGLETVRRDNSPLVANTINICLQKLLIHKDPEGAIKYTKQVISDLLCNRIDISQLVISKELTKGEGAYAAKQAHVELAKKLTKRDPGNAPKMGDRVPYVLIAATKNTPAYAKAEDPIYVLENNIPIDAKYYLENQLSKPLVRIFQPILGDKTESILLHGDHTRSKTVATSKVSALSAFTRKMETCLGCRAVLSAGDDSRALCKHCLPREATLYQQDLAQLRHLEERFSRLWAECQRCQGSLHEEVLCTNRDCPIFYMRKKVQLELVTCDKRVQRFDDCEW
uniref:DNA polymerase n=1 Tax=Protohermes grandis TaxID=621229 RepID=E9RHR2_9NEOP|nr:DNA polymerase delta catalytic subunit [Protohermes grandis]